jgi:16S rRNA C967 or C1407 C5-methylase (RsmB/RsmF family)
VTHFLRSEKKPDGHKLEDLLMQLRADMIHRCDVIAADTRPEALHVMANNMKILGLLSEAITLSLDSTRMLDRAFGPSQAAQGGPPRIGKQDGVKQDAA